MSGEFPDTEIELVGETEFEKTVLHHLKSLDRHIRSTDAVAARALTMAEENRTIGLDHERTLYGHEDSRRRGAEPGVVQVVGELASAFKDVKAVARAGWAMLGLVGFSTIVSLFSLFMRLQ
jgi:hypothetical protein